MLSSPRCFLGPGPPAELRRLRSDGENVLAQAEREKQALSQTLNAAQLEAQQALHKVVREHQEEVERLVSEKVGKSTSPPNTPFLKPRVLMAALPPPHRRPRVAACWRSRSWP